VLLAARLAALGFVACTAWPAVTLADPTNQDCFECHGEEAAKEQEHPPIVAQTDFAASAHADLDCAACHTDVTDVPHDSKLKPVGFAPCSDCHDDIVKTYQQGSHWKAREIGFKAAPSCPDCHGDIHKVKDHTADESPEHWAALAEVCARCHADPEVAAQLDATVVRPVEAYLKSAHARAVSAGKHGAVCSDCHEPHRTLPPTDPSSSIWPMTVPRTCGHCHADILEKFQRSVHGQALTLGIRDAPGCTDCHGEHRILSVSDPDSPVFVANVPRDTCGRCHGNTRLVERHNLSDKNFSAFQDSFHGLAIRAGETSVASCSSCHGVHDILPAADPRSNINPANLATTCGACHPGAGERFAVGPVHVSATLSKTRLEYWIRLVYLWMIAAVVGGMLLHNLVDFVGKVRRPTVHHIDEDSPIVVRMPRVLRWQHGLVMISFPTLVFSGFALTSPESWWARPLLHLETTYDFRGWTHRSAAIVLILAVLWHLGGLLKSAKQREYMRGMWWAWSDVRFMLAMLAYYSGIRRLRPKTGKFCYIEKAEYWAFMWGMFLMGATGLPLWFADVTLRYLPKWFTDVATALHFYEAVLATLAILVWHMYWVVFDPDVYPGDMSWWHGQAPPARNEEREVDAEPEQPAAQMPTAPAPPSPPRWR